MICFSYNHSSVISDSEIYLSSKQMFKQLKNGFIPHGSVSQKFESEQVRYEAVKLSAGVSCHVMDSGLGIDLDDLNKRSAAALAELVTTELLYYHQLGEIGCFLASAYSDEENQNHDQPQPQVDESDSSDSDLELDSDSDSECGDDAEPGLLCRSQSHLPESVPMPVPVPVPAMTRVNQLSANLLIASGRVRQKILEIATSLGVAVGMFGPASLRNTEYVERRHIYGLVLHEIFVALGGKGDSANNDEIFCQLRSQVMQELCEVSKMTWTLMNLCAMTNTFRFMLPDDPLFSTVKIDPLESVFGNRNRRWSSPFQSSDEPATATATATIAPAAAATSSKAIQCSPAMATCDGMFHHSP